MQQNAMEKPSSSQQQKDLLGSCLDAAKVSILSVGSGDGSQQEAIVKQGHNKVLTTFYDSKALLLQKYPHAGGTLDFLTRRSQWPPIYQVDATRLHTYSGILGKFDLIIFTFPHTGVPNSDRNNAQSNRDLIRRFLQSAQQLLSPGGQIQITLKVGSHYDKWKVPELLQEHGALKYQGSHGLEKSMFPGYVHRLTKGAVGNMKEVHDKHGANVHVFSNVITIGGKSTSVSNENPSQTVVVTPPSVDSLAWYTDVELHAHLVSCFHLEQDQEDRPRNVLELRRRFFEDPKPDTRQMNRVLYAMKESGLVSQHPPRPGATSKKPCWVYHCTL